MIAESPLVRESGGTTYWGESCRRRHDGADSAPSPSANLAGVRGAFQARRRPTERARRPGWVGAPRARNPRRGSVERWTTPGQACGQPGLPFDALPLATRRRPPLSLRRHARLGLRRSPGLDRRRPVPPDGIPQRNAPEHLPPTPRPPTSADPKPPPFRPFASCRATAPEVCPIGRASPSKTPGRSSASRLPRAATKGARRGDQR